MTREVGSGDAKWSGGAGNSSSRQRQDSSEDKKSERRQREDSRGERWRDRARDSKAAGSADEERHRARPSSDRRRRDSNDRDRHDRRHHPNSHDRSSYRHRSRSPRAKPRKDPSLVRSQSPVRKSRGALPSQNESFRGEKSVEGAECPPPEKQKPNFKPTGLLAKEANTVAGTATVLKYHEPPEARKPPAKEPWRLYVFKDKAVDDTIHLHQRSVWLVGRDKLVTDLLLEHPSISKQHAVIQFRYTSSTDQYGDKTSRVKPYLIDLESANGTKLNGTKVDASRFIEIVDADVIQFGDSEREYVFMLPPTE